MKLEIISPEQRLYLGEVVSVTLPGLKGSFTLLNHHAPIISSLSAGKISYKEMEKEVVELEVKGGFIEMNNNHVTVCVE